jgi:GNAT superfamily N-acetyltransferase
MNGPLSIEACTAPDAAWLGVLAAACYERYYAGLWEPGAMTAYLAETYAPRRLAAELTDENIHFDIAWQHGHPVGFMKTHSRCDRVETPNAAYLERVYVLPAVAGQGVGTRLIEHALARARVARRAWIWLQAMADADRPLGRYAALGFVVCGHTHLAVPGVRRDRAAMLVLRRRP